MTTRQQSTLEEFHQRLYQEWTRHVACQNQCQPPELCSCRREIIHVDALCTWLRRTLSELNGTTNLHRLLQELHTGHRKFPLEHDTYFTGKYQCLRVFSLLLKNGFGHLVDRFYQSQMSDDNIHHDGSFERLRENLSDVLPSNEVEPIIQKFRREKWSFCPLELEMHIDRPLEGTRVIAPFCHKIKLNEGGTASVYLVAVQEDLIRDPRLKAVLQDSLYDDSTFGPCYKMAMKTYVGNKRSAFEAEKDAFSAFRSDTEVPIVRYLGSFTHDYGEGIVSDDYHLQKTYNLLLEYGELDLYQYWADETNIPPVRVHEIICYWEKLFEIAVAIRSVHHLDVSQWKSPPLKYYGWHADIKPDNILLVNGRFKLADFGYSAFTPVAKTKIGAVPTDYIHGFTDSYGAPEVSRMTRRNGTASEVTQSIDTWSFGCVLSVAATWVVLGFQGVRQYETLRRLSPANQKTYDRFHNGFDVLPEVKKWHNYLRGHLRQSDTATSMLLDLIEHKMLQTETDNRIDMRKLCKELKKLIKDAKEEANGLETHTRITDSLVLQALLALEKEAQALSSEPKTNPLLRRSKGADASNKPQIGAQEASSLRKDAAIRSTPLGQTTFRKEILESELQEKSFMQASSGELQENSSTDVHRGEMTESPVDAHPADLVQAGHINSTRLHPIVGTQHHGHHKEVRLSHLLKSKPRDLSRSTTNGSYAVGSTQTLPYSHKHGFSHASSSTSRPPSRYLPQDPHNAESHAMAPVQTTASQRTLPEFTLAHQPVRKSDHRAKDWSPERFEEWPPANIPTIAHTEDTSTKSSAQIPRSSIEDHAGTPEKFVQSSQILLSHANRVPLMRLPTPRSSYPRSEAMHVEAGRGSSVTQPSPTSPSITVTPCHDPSPSRTPTTASPSGSSHDTGKQVVAPQEHDHMHYDELPHTIHDLPYPICHVRNEIDKEIPKGMQSHLKRLLRGEERKANTSLKKTYGSDRDIILIVDNGWTMCQHWPIVTFVAETLVKNAAGLDKDGIDLMFTVDGGALDIPKIRGENGRQSLQGALRKAWPEAAKSDDTIVDMARILTDIYNNWKSKGKNPPATTLLILTDGDWAKTDHTALNEIILDFAKLETKRAGPRHFSIQLIRFGEENKEKLIWLDDQLCQQNQRKDIVDHCSWRTTVEKMFKGSIETYQDSQAPLEPEITYYYPHLVKFFDSFNDGGASLLSPDGQNQSRLSLSRTSSRSSTQRKHESAPPERVNSGPRTHRKTYSVQDTDIDNKEYG